LASSEPKRCTITGRSTEKPNGYWVVSGNVWPELITVGTVMRPMVSDMEARIKSQDARAAVKRHIAEHGC
jgi:hypothetical protein